MERIDVGILGATGMVGQQFIAAARGSSVVQARVACRQRAIRGQALRARRRRGIWPAAPPASIASQRVEACTPGRGPRLIFSALDANAATRHRARVRRAPATWSSATRATTGWIASVPLLIPEINPDHLALLPRQRRDHGWPGAIVTNPNCSTVVLAMVLAPLRQFGLRAVNVTTLQAVSGAGYPGVASLDILGNVIPSSRAKKRRCESETQKILGTLDDDGASRRIPSSISAHTTRVSGDRRPHGNGVYQAGRRARRSSDVQGGAARRGAGGRRSSSCRPRRRRRSSAWTRPTGRSRGSMPAAAAA